MSPVPVPIAIVNRSTILSDTDLRPIVKALQLQVGKHFYPKWNLNAILTHYYPGQKPPAASWQLGVFDDADQANALGYHDVTATGQPLAKCFVKVTQGTGLAFSTVMSHELLEMLLDPYVNLLVADPTRRFREWAYEVCDAVEADEYDLEGIKLSNFVLPAYFQPDLKLGKPYDYLGLLSGPLPALTSGGYMIYREAGSWGQIFGNTRKHGASGIIGGDARGAKFMLDLPRRASAPDTVLPEVQAP